MSDEHESERADAASPSSPTSEPRIAWGAAPASDVSAELSAVPPAPSPVASPWGTAGVTAGPSTASLPGLGAPGPLGRCAHHPDASSVARCTRCGDNLCAPCAADAPDGVCAPCRARLATRGLVPHVEWLAWVMIVHGVLLAGYGLFATIYMLVVAVVFGQDASLGPGPEVEAMRAFLGPMMGLVGVAMGAAMFVPGVLQIVGGWSARRFERRWLVVVGLVAGLAGLVGCYCFPTALILLVWGLFVMVDEAVVERFRLTRV